METCKLFVISSCWWEFNRKDKKIPASCIKYDMQLIIYQPLHYVIRPLHSTIHFLIKTDDVQFGNRATQCSQLACLSQSPDPVVRRFLFPLSRRSRSFPAPRIYFLPTEGRLTLVRLNRISVVSPCRTARYHVKDQRNISHHLCRFSTLYSYLVFLASHFHVSSHVLYSCNSY